tara:strand:+ start:115 stop:543 length:429 start_codon:yes stop_codon:yes gene_type:complete
MALTKAEKQRLEDLENKIETILNSMQNEFLAREKKYNYFEERLEKLENLKVETKSRTGAETSTGNYILVKNERRGSGWIETVMNNQERFVFCSPEYKEGHRFSKEGAINLLQLLNNEIAERNKGKARKEKDILGIVIKEVNK